MSSGNAESSTSSGNSSTGTSESSTAVTPQPGGPQLPPLSPTNIVPDNGSSLSPGATDRVFPIRSVVSVDPTPTPSIARFDRSEGYFPPGSATGSSRRRQSEASASDGGRSRQPSTESRSGSVEGDFQGNRRMTPAREHANSRLQPQLVNALVTGTGDTDSIKSAVSQSHRTQSRPGSLKSTKSSIDEAGGLYTARFKHVVTENGHAIITGRDGDALQRCEDEPIHIPGAIQSFGLLIALHEDRGTGNLQVRIASENSKRMIGRTPAQLFALESFCDILSEEQADNLLDHIDFIRDEDTDVQANGPEVFTLSIKSPEGRPKKLWCGMHINPANPNYIICEFELEEDLTNPLVPLNEGTPDLPEDTLSSNPTQEEYLESTQIMSRPLRVLRSARKRKGEAAAMEVFNIMSQVQEQLATAPNLEKFLKVLVGVVKELTGFHRVMIYQFDQQFNGRVVTELVDPRATKDLYKGLNFPASDIPRQARELYKVNRVRLLYDRDLETARLVCRTMEDLETPLDLTHSYLRAMSPIHLKYLTNMAVRSSMSISINAFNELWGLIACHSYGHKGMRVSFPIRKMCRLVGDSASRNIERLSYASRLQARKLINTVPTQANPSGYIIASSEDLLKLFDADFGLLSIRDETKTLGSIEQTQEALAMLEYLRMRKVTSVITSNDVKQDFPDLRYAPGFSIVAGMLVVPLSVSGNDFIVFFRKGQLKEVKWAGNPYEKFVREGTEGYLEPRKSFKVWSETVVGKSREWTEEEIETAAVLCLVYGKFIEVWRQKEAALQNSQLTRLLLANSAHEVRTPLNAIINYLEIALEGSLDQETRDNLAKSHSASKSLIYVINDLLDLTKTVEGGELIKGEAFELRSTLREATDLFNGDARRKGIDYEVVEAPDLPTNVIGDQRKVRQAISNITANAIQNTSTGGVKVEMLVSSWEEEGHADIEVIVQDTGAGMSEKKLDALFGELEQVQTEADHLTLEESLTKQATITEGSDTSEEQKSDSAQGATTREHKKTLGLGLAVVARIVRNMNGQLRLKSEEGKGTRFAILFPFDLPDSEKKPSSKPGTPSEGVTPQAEEPGELTLIRRAEPRPVSTGPSMMRKDSADSLKSRKSLRSIASASSRASGKSDVDRLIEAIQEPHQVQNRPQVERKLSARSRLENRLSVASHPSSPERPRARSLDDGQVATAEPEQLRSPVKGEPGEEILPYSATPLRAVRVPEEYGQSGSETASVKSGIIGEVGAHAEIEQGSASGSTSGEPSNQKLTADRMRVLVAEDDPVNSRIVKKRLEKAGHDIYMTVNGEECASAFGDCARSDRPDKFDVVLMDMQMPIVDGLTSTKMIRAFEKTHSPELMLSARAKQVGRIPIIAVSASLIEKERQTYIDAGFDAWILKPISFNRLGELMSGIVDQDTRKACLYKPGNWEKGGWFELNSRTAFEAETRPTCECATAQGVADVKQAEEPSITAVAEGPDDTDKERERLLANQEKGKEKEAPPENLDAEGNPPTSSMEMKDFASKD